MDLFKHHQVRPQPCSETWSINNTLQVFWGVFLFCCLRHGDLTQGTGMSAEVDCVFAALTLGTGMGTGADRVPVTPTRGIGTGAGVGYDSGWPHSENWNGCRSRLVGWSELNNNFTAGESRSYMRNGYRCRSWLGHSRNRDMCRNQRSFSCPSNRDRDWLTPSHPGSRNRHRRRLRGNLRMNFSGAGGDKWTVLERTECGAKIVSEVFA